MPPIRETVEIIDFMGPEDPVSRMKIAYLAKHLPDIRFVGPGTARRSSGVLIRADLREPPPQRLIDYLKRKRRHAVVMLHVPDFWAQHQESLRRFDEVADLYLTPTPELRDFLSAFTTVKVAYLFDPIDFDIGEGAANPARPAGAPLRLMWFGHLASFEKSMAPYLPTVESLVTAGAIEFHVVTRFWNGVTPEFMRLHEYDHQTFRDLAAEFDACVLSHQPFDFSAATLMKSENKAVLAIALGLPVIASRTPAYGRLLHRHGLGDYLYRSGTELEAAARLLTDPARRQSYLDKCQDAVLREYSTANMARNWLSHFLRARKTRADAEPLAETGVGQPDPGLSRS